MCHISHLKYKPHKIGGDFLNRTMAFYCDANATFTLSAAYLTKKYRMKCCVFYANSEAFDKLGMCDVSLNYLFHILFKLQSTI